MAEKRVIKIPKDLLEATEFLAQIGQEQRASIDIALRLNNVIERLKQRAILKDTPHQDKIAELVEGLYLFAEANRETLLEGKRKSVELPTGSFGWRMTPPAVTLKDVDSIVESLKQLGLEHFIRTKEEVNKEAMLEDQETARTVKGVTISQREDFLIKPSDLGIEVATPVSKLKKQPRKNKKGKKKTSELV